MDDKEQADEEEDNKEFSTKGVFEIEEQDLMEYKQKHVTWTQIIGGSVGNILEWYDFAGITIQHSYKSFTIYCTSIFPLQKKNNKNKIDQFSVS